MELIRRFFNPPKHQGYFLFGPRGTGKSTWIKNFYSNSLTMTFDLLDHEQFRQLSSRPESLKEKLEGSPERSVVLIDEIQKVPELLPIVHQLIENKKGCQFILTGSSSRKLKRSGADLLAGRALNRSMHPFMAAELGSKFQLQSALTQGLLPVAWQTENVSETLRAYVSLYIREEVQLEGLVRNIGNFHRFLEAISFSHASLLNMNNIARECQIERKVVQNYISVLEDLLLAHRLEVFTKRAQRETSAHPKFYLFDSGVFYTMRPKGPLDRPEEMQGLALEGLIAQHLRAWISYSNTDDVLSFWRTRHGLEVDFVMHGESGLIAIEVKNTLRLRDEELRGLKAFLEDYPEAKTLYLYRGKDRIKKGKILCLPVEEFLLNLKPNQSIF